MKEKLKKETNIVFPRTITLIDGDIELFSKEVNNIKDIICEIEWENKLSAADPNRVLKGKFKDAMIKEPTKSQGIKGLITLRYCGLGSEKRSDVWATDDEYNYHPMSANSLFVERKANV